MSNRKFKKQQKKIQKTQLLFRLAFANYAIKCMKIQEESSASILSFLTKDLDKSYNKC